ncbi:hypothetical protein BN946_scf184864.g3, partial [Trametes cinnabarina]
MVATAVAEQAEEWLALQLNDQTMHMEAKVEEMLKVLMKAKKELQHCGQRLREACDWVGQGSQGIPGNQLSSFDFWYIIRCCPHLQWQVLIRDTMLLDPEGQPIKDAITLKQAIEAVEDLVKAGLSPPGDGKIDEAKTLQHGDIILTTSSTEMACWFLKLAVAKAFLWKLGLWVQIVECLYKLVAERVPVIFNPADQAGLHSIEECHGLQAGAIVQADWIKPVSWQCSEQTTAHLMLTVMGIE